MVPVLINIAHGLAALAAWLEAHDQAILVVITVVYVTLTWLLLREARRQNELHSRQVLASLRPLPLVERESVPDGWEYYVNNVGPGLALDLVYVRDKGELGGADLATFYYLGSLPSGKSRQVPGEASSELSSYATASNLGHEVPRHLVFSRPIVSDEWIVSSNKVQPGNGHVQAATQTIRFSRQQMNGLATVGAAKYFEQHWSEIKAMLSQ